MSTYGRRAAAAIRRVAAAGLVLAAVFAGPPPAWAEFIEVPFQLPAAFVGWCCNTAPGSQLGQFSYSAGFTPYGPVPPQFPQVGADGGAGGVGDVHFYAEGGAGENQFASAMATQGGRGFAQAFVLVQFVDPQGRPEIKIISKVKGAVTVDNSDESNPSFGSFFFTLGIADTQHMFLRFQPPYTGVWEIHGPSMPFPIVKVEGSPSIPGVRITNRGVTETLPGSGDYVYYRAYEDPIHVLVEPGVWYLMEVFAWASGKHAVVYADPVLEPHPDNPDVIVQVRASVDPPSRPPFYWTTPEQLAAAGIDPTPLLQLGLFGGSNPPTPADTVPPVTAATVTPTPNAEDWNNGAVTVNLAAADNPGGSGVKEIRLARSGASSGSQVVPGSSAAAAISAEGETTVTYFAVDNAGNQETPKTMTVRIDTTPPVLAGLPAAGCTLWPPDHRLVRVAAVTASDGLAGLATGAQVVTATSNEPEIGSGDSVTAPDIVISGGAVEVRAEREGVGNGRIYTITASATDRAGNQVSATRTCTVPHNRP